MQSMSSKFHSQMPAMMQRGELEEDEEMTSAVLCSMLDNEAGRTSSLDLQQVSMACCSSHNIECYKVSRFLTTSHCEY